MAALAAHSTEFLIVATNLLLAHCTIRATQVEHVGWHYINVPRVRRRKTA